MAFYISQEFSEAEEWFENLRDEIVSELEKIEKNKVKDIIEQKDASKIQQKINICNSGILICDSSYLFKSIKSISSIRFVDKQPEATWSMMAPSEYGFYSNVNNLVDHPRWSQGTERRIGEFKRRKTLPFNGYEEEVSYLYKGMDLRKYY